MTITSTDDLDFTYISDFVDDDDSSSDDSFIFDTGFSTAVALTPATSFISTDEDTVQEMLDTLLEDPLLRWDILLNFNCKGINGPDKKDVKFFLKTYEVDLCATANATLDHHACAFLRSRVRFFSSQICKRFRLVGEETKSTSRLDAFDSLPDVTMEKLGPALMLPSRELVPFRSVANRTRVSKPT